MNVESVVPGLHHLFRAYEWLDQAIFGRLLQTSQAGPFIRILRHLSFEGWRTFFGEAIATPAHARYVLRWCLKNVEVFREAKLLSGQDHYAIAVEILSDLEKLPPGDPTASFSSSGGPGQVAQNLRRLYLVHNLHLRLHVLVAEGRIDPTLFERVRRNIFTMARELFVSTLGEHEYAAAEPAQCLVEALDAALRKRLLGRDQYLGLKTLLESMMARERSGEALPEAGAGPASSDRDSIIAELAAANGLMNEVRKNSFLAPDDRKHYETCLMHEFRALIARLSGPPDRSVVDGVARRLGIVLPLSTTDSQTMRIQDLAKDQQAGEKIDATWASEIVQEATTRS